KQRYVYNGERFTLNQLYKLAKPHMGKKDILGSVYATLDNGIPVKILFVRNRNKRSEWLAILSTDTTLENEEIIRIYGMRWDIEVFFKCNKSLLNLEKEFQGRSYDMLISHTTIVFTRYILIAWQMRKEEDPKTIGNLFYILCEDVKDIDFITAFNHLLTFSKLWRKPRFL
ncbi:IS4 family transposase, partial [Caldibacillus thermoamylovorans]|nr:IS4 family transposase [Caldibacillus thermoamylovorans]